MKILLAFLVALFAVSTFAKEPLKVFVLVGQSNMEGHGHVKVLDYLGDDPATKPLLDEIKNEDGSFKPIKNTWISYLTSLDGKVNQPINGQLMAGYGSQFRRDLTMPGEKIGPELGFGMTMQKAVDEPILIIKAAWGGKSLSVDFRSPSSGAYEQTEANARKFDTEEKRQALKENTGIRYREMIAHVQAVLKDIKSVYPDYDPAQGHELAGMVWFQGWNDLVDSSTYPNRSEAGGYDQYSEWMANFIRDARKDLEAPKMPFVIGVMGVSGALETMEERHRKNHGNFRDAMAAPSKLPEFKGNVVAVQTAPFWDADLAAIDKKRNEMRGKNHSLKTKNKNHENGEGKMTPDDIKKFMADYEKKMLTQEDLDLEARGKSNAGYHYLGSVKTMTLIGKAFAEALVDLEKK
ncbi:sialate O-acetylesterase [Verrucomicrobiales bacterium]|nr:sialate O-acetylesterase [Verrucomicrobiales bacterium]MDC0312017.1 sialate O-acetylesterase [bacterium]